MKIFHGGCHGCTMQDKYGVVYCVDCCYFRANWSLPDKNDRRAKEKAEEEIIKEKAEKEYERKMNKPAPGNPIKEYVKKVKQLFSNSNNN